jgi:nitroimidazol reductase NimA-like FMN-containing flavoprotein (pyridoxamine 5'-phosphate oxidase superfamily)/GNAT superfamily N-acetyltransferase
MFELVLFDGPFGKHLYRMAQLNSPAPAPDVEIHPTPRTALKRHAERGTYDRAALDAILDEALVCHAAVVVDGTPRVLPMAHARVSERLYVHGARGNRLLGLLAAGAPACITVTLLDGLVFGRTWFHHSMNFRSAVLYGAGGEVSDRDEKLVALASLIDKAAPGRTREARPPTPEELLSTLVVRFPIMEASAKVRVGPPLDGPDLFSEEGWAGELPLRLTVLPAKDDANLRSGIAASVAVGERARTLTSGAVRPYERARDDLVVSTDPRRIDFSFVHRFLSEESYWARGIDERRQRLAMTHSLSFGVYRGAEQVGFARVLTDYGRLAYLGDLFVAQNARGHGIGKWLVATVLDHPDLATVDRWLLGTADAHRLYERFGFVRADPDRYMVRRRP